MSVSAATPLPVLARSGSSSPNTPPRPEGTEQAEWRSTGNLEGIGRHEQSGGEAGGGDEIDDRRKAIQLAHMPHQKRRVARTRPSSDHLSSWPSSGSASQSGTGGAEIRAGTSAAAANGGAGSTT